MSKFGSLKHLLSGFLLVLFVFSGALKWMTFLWVDPTILFGSMVAAWALIAIVANPVPLHPATHVLLWNLGFLGIYMASAIFSISPLFKTTKIAAVLLDTLALCAPVALFRSEAALGAFVRILQWVTFCATVAVHYFYWTGNITTLNDSIHRDITKLPDYLVLGYLSGINIIICVFSPSKTSFIQLIGSVIALLALSGRGPVIFVPISILIVYFLKRGRGASVGKAGGTKAVLFIALLVGGLAFWEGGDLLQQRFSASYDASAGRLADTSRRDEFLTALAAFSQFPILGTGIGGYGVAAYGLDQNIYPHNLILEALAESGIVGGGFFLMCMVAIWRVSWRTLVSPTRVILFSCLLYTFFNYMKSGGFIGARDFYVLVGAVLASVLYKSVGVVNISAKLAPVAGRLGQ